MLIAAAILVTQMSAPAQKPQSPFAPLDEWKSAVISGDSSSLAKLYSANPSAVARAGKNPIALSDELAFWASLKKAGLTSFNPRILEVTTEHGNTVLVLRISIVSGGSHLVTGMRQQWKREAGGWKMAASVRGAEFTAEANRTLPQPAAPNVALYSDPREAQAELHAALVKAAHEHKRVLAVFGANWCYDCHVLDTTFHSQEFARLVDPNFVVVHINIGDEGKDNNDLAARLGVAIAKGVPSLAVLEPDGKVVYSQKNGEFEATEKIGPQDVRSFLEKWKPAGL